MNKLIVIYLIFICTKLSFAQYYDPEKAKEVAKDSNLTQKPTLKPAFDVEKHVYYGANVGLRGSNRGTLVEFSPVIGFDITEKLSVGTMINCIYFKPRNFDGIGLFGVTPFVRFLITNDIYIVGELSNIYYPKEIVAPKAWQTYPMLGVGYLLHFSKKFALNSSILYNFNNKPPQLYGPWVPRVGFVFRIHD